jgi:hypothetical protein
MRATTVAAALALAIPVLGCGGGTKEETPPPAPVQQASPVAPVNARPVPTVTTKRNIVYVLDTVRTGGANLTVEGWAFLDTDPADKKKPLDARDSEIYVVLAPSAGAATMFRAKTVARPDISKAYGPNLDQSGFTATIPKASLTRGTYRVGIYVRLAGEEAVTFSDKLAVIN